jgi:hypothetical protein
MLSIGRLGVATGAEYYLEKVANSVDDYYLGHGEAPGLWIGATAEQLGLTGEVDADQLRSLLTGFSPDGASLGMQLRADRRPGYDLTFSAPKGVSLLWAFSSDQTRAEITQPHDRAVVAVLDQLSREASFARRGANGQTLIEAKASSAPLSGTGPAGPGTPSSTPTWSCPTWSREQTAGGGPRRPPPLRLEEDRRHALSVGVAVRAGPPGSVLGGPAQRSLRAGRPQETHPAGLLQATGGY